MLSQVFVAVRCWMTEAEAEAGYRFLMLLTVPALLRQRDEAVERHAKGQRRVGFAKFCQKCRIPKAPRSHHCSICGW